MDLPIVRNTILCSNYFKRKQKIVEENKYDKREDFGDEIFQEGLDESVQGYINDDISELVCKYQNIKGCFMYLGTFSKWSEKFIYAKKASSNNLGNALESIIHESFLNFEVYEKNGCLYVALADNMYSTQRTDYTPIEIRRVEGDLWLDSLEGKSMSELLYKSLPIGREI